MNILTVKVRRSIAVAAWPKAWVCGRSLAEIAGFESRQEHEYLL